MEVIDIKQLREDLGITQELLAKRLGVSTKTISNWEKGGVIPQSKYDMILALKTEGTKTEGESLKVEVHKKKTHRNLIPFYDAETTGGNIGYVSDSNLDVHFKGYVDAGDWFAGRETAAIKHVGDSMIEYPDGCILAVRAVENFRLLVPGKNYVIETSEYRITKKVQFGKKPGTLVLHSTNREKYEDGSLVHQSFTIEMEDVRRIFSVLGYIVSQSGESHFIKI